MSKGPEVRIIKKKVVGHAAHHGGSWKVAYADFVTAMMAFFLVMWIISMNDKVKEEVQAYFNDPLSASDSRSGISKLAAGGRSPLATGFAGIMNQKISRPPTEQAQEQRFQRVKAALGDAIHGQPNLSSLSEHVNIGVTEAGMTVDLLETDKGLFFASGSAQVPPPTRKLLEVIAQHLGKLPNPISIEGHTDAVPYQSRAGYGNWELSTDRANAARRVLEESGLQPRQVVEIRGYADRVPKDPKDPRGARNRRISIVVHYGKNEQQETTEELEEELRKPFEVELKPEGMPRRAGEPIRRKPDTE